MVTSPLSEFSLIDRYFARRARRPEARAALGIGDDCALLAPHPDTMLAISTDMLVEGRHFFADVAPRALGHKTLAVNLSDLAAMGAQPRAFTLAFALPRADADWLDAFSDGLFTIADRYGCELVGGDTTSGPLNLCVTVFGDVGPDRALRRDAARPGDEVWVSGTLGVALGLALAGIAHAALDISDGLAGDLRHILERSRVAADIEVDAVPRSAALATLAPELQRTCTLAGGDDYELCFTAPAAAHAAVLAAGVTAGVAVTRIGTIRALAAPDEVPAIRWLDDAGAPLALTLRGFDHFHAGQ